MDCQSHQHGRSTLVLIGYYQRQQKITTKARQTRQRGALLEREVPRFFIKKGNSMIRIQTQVNTNLRPSPGTDNVPIKSYSAGTIQEANGRSSPRMCIKTGYGYNAFEIHGYEPAGTAMPLVAPGGDFFINKSACLELEPGAIWTPYL